MIIWVLPNDRKEQGHPPEIRRHPLRQQGRLVLEGVICLLPIVSSQVSASNEIGFGLMQFSQTTNPLHVFNFLKGFSGAGLFCGKFLAFCENLDLLTSLILFKHFM